MNWDDLKQVQPIDLQDTKRREKLAALYHNDRFPRSNAYDPIWIFDHEMGQNPLWLTEWLCERMDLKPGMRILDMGCGQALTSIFLAKEYGVQVWATDLWISANDNWKRICEAGLQDSVFPIHADASSLPYADHFFDAAISIDSYAYYGTNDLYLKYFHRFIKPGGHIGIVEVALMQEFGDAPPPHLFTVNTDHGYPYVGWGADSWRHHTLDWWIRHWRKTGLVDVALAETMENGWLEWLKDRRAQYAGTGGHPEGWPNLVAKTLLEDAGQYIGFLRMIAKRLPDQPLLAGSV